VDDPRWLVDEMLGRLARYLRFLGYDTEYVRNAADDEIIRRAQAERRRVVTRDRGLAARSPGSILLRRTDIAGQVAELGEAFPDFRREVRFDRCSVCNGRLTPVEKVPPTSGRGTGLPPEVRSGRVQLYSCTHCGHLYWEGSHTRSVRARITRWLPEPRVG
jgi:uncharacterized protein